METSRGARLALLLLEGFNGMTAEVVAELARQGHPGVTATHEFTLRAIDEGANDASAVSRGPANRLYGTSLGGRGKPTLNGRNHQPGRAVQASELT